MLFYVVLSAYIIIFIKWILAPLLHYIEQCVYTKERIEIGNLKQGVLLEKKISLLDDCLLYYQPTLTERFGRRAGTGRHFFVCISRYEFEIKDDNGVEVKKLVFCQEPVVSYFKRLNKSYKIWVNRRQDYLSKPEYYIAVTKLDYLGLVFQIIMFGVWCIGFYGLVNLIAILS